ncbi:hypothetical protein HMPREF3038_02593 [Akkermansia sp. KLE1797]|nr:hypothetical protein HMPREF3038_02593 [Akkermansia sp. KLE1797]KXU52989.1 hypothetical protein HMPREF3039_02858 [Akkermansia sp. KLE1798]
MPGFPPSAYGRRPRCSSPSYKGLFPANKKRTPIDKTGVR